MHNKWRLAIAIILILIISWLDYQYFVERNTHLQVSDNIRKIFHMLSFAGVAVTGCIAWKPVSKIVFTLWTGAHIAAFLFMALIWILNRFFHFSDDFLNEVSRLRMFFCSPMPFAALYIFYRLLKKPSAGS